jgi:hypothetical protein
VFLGGGDVVGGSAVESGADAGDCWADSLFLEGFRGLGYSAFEGVEAGGVEACAGVGWGLFSVWGGHGDNNNAWRYYLVPILGVAAVMVAVALVECELMSVRRKLRGWAQGRFNCLVPRGLSRVAAGGRDESVAD